MKHAWFLLLIFALKVHAQSVRVLTTRPQVSLRGLSVVSDKVVWASGSKGTVCRSTDGGLTWSWQTVKGFEKNDFRDIEAFDSLTAIIMAVAEPSYILKTTDGGTTWQTVYENQTKGMFLDAMDFRDKMNGIVLGDPLNNQFFIATTTDGGKSWQEEIQRVSADSGEACFASSGTNIRVTSQGRRYFVSGGLKSRLYVDGNRIELPLLQGKESTGANSVAVKNAKIIAVTGGDFNAPTSSEGNCVITFNGGKTWKVPASPPHGYRSCIEYITKEIWLTCGLNGVDYSSDDGNNWRSISGESFHVCRKAKVGNKIFLAGNGKIGVLE